MLPFYRKYTSVYPPKLPKCPALRLYHVTRFEVHESREKFTVTSGYHQRCVPMTYKHVAVTDC